MASQYEKARNFVDLHAAGTFIIANFWDAGSAVLLERLGFKALATTSAGFAQALGRLDGQVTLDEKLAHCAQAAAVTQVPISVDFENGFADAPDRVAANLIRLAGTGVVGASIEDYCPSGIYERGLAAERIAACAEAARTLDFPFTLTARAENLIRGVQDLDDTIERLLAYEAAGADVLYAPGLASRDQTQAVLQAVTRPVNVLGAVMPDLTLADYAALGVRRVSLGGALANHAIGATLRASRSLLDSGDFSWVKEGASGRVIRDLLG
ncbi:MAG: isocitrate lyase/phosphoenolpyruvate mutase family protein [Pseudomonadales bacterium]